MTSPVSAPSAVDRIAAQFWEDYLALSPLTATVYGDERYADRLDDPSREGRWQALSLARRVKQEVAAIPDDGLSVEDRITRDMLDVVADLSMEEHELAFHEIRAVDQISGPQTVLSRRDPESGAGFALVLTPEGMALEVGGTRTVVGKRLRSRVWYRVWASADPRTGTVRVGQQPLRRAHAVDDEGEAETVAPLPLAL